MWISILLIFYCSIFYRTSIFNAELYVILSIFLSEGNDFAIDKTVVVFPLPATASATTFFPLRIALIIACYSDEGVDVIIF